MQQGSGITEMQAVGQTTCSSTVVTTLGLLLALGAACSACFVATVCRSLAGTASGLHSYWTTRAR